MKLIDYCKELIDAKDRKEKFFRLVRDRRVKEGHPKLEAMNDWPEYKDFRVAMADERTAENAIRRVVEVTKFEQYLDDGVVKLATRELLGPEAERDLRAPSCDPDRPDMEG